MTAGFISKETLPCAFVPLTFKRGLLQVKGCIWETKMYLRSISALAVITALGGCGGSSDGSAVNPVRSVPVPEPEPVPVSAVLESFTDGSGVAQSPITFTDLATVVGGDVGNVLTRDAIAKVNGVFFNGVTIATASESTDTILDGFRTYDQLDSTTPQTVKQSLLINGELVDATLIYDQNIRSYIIQTPRELIAAGMKVTNIQTANGKYVFEGHNAVDNRGVGVPQYGTFSMEVDFTGKTATVATAGTATTIATAVGSPMVVNNRNGTFSGDNLIITTGGQGQPGSMKGNFHGDFAPEATGQGVSGLYYNRDGTVTGAIAGSGAPVPPP